MTSAADAGNPCPMAVSSQHHSQHHHVTPLHTRAGASTLATAFKSKFPLSAAPWDLGAIRDKTPGTYGRSFPHFYFLRAAGSECSPASRKKHIYKCDEKNARRNGLVGLMGSLRDV
jgi:hypothetical protein